MKIYIYKDKFSIISRIIKDKVFSKDTVNISKKDSFKIEKDFINAQDNIYIKVNFFNL